MAFQIADNLQEEVASLLQKAFAEDSAFDDLTTKACIAEEDLATAHILLKEDACLAGLCFIPMVFQAFDPRLETALFFEEGILSSKNTILAKITGPAQSILSAERVALNLVQHLSGIATLTHACVQKVQGTKCEVLDTRKTILGWRALQKYAVKTGGGVNHRPHLGGGILIKNNHLALTAKKGGEPIAYAIAAVRKRYPEREIEVEISSYEQLPLALDAGAERILLDNMSPPLVEKCCLYNKGQAYLEASGRITLDTIRAYAEAGVDGVSLGALTHSARAIDLSLRM